MTLSISASMARTVGFYAGMREKIGKKYEF
jgi:hypothetical protein